MVHTVPFARDVFKAALHLFSKTSGMRSAEEELKLLQAWL